MDGDLSKAHEWLGYFWPAGRQEQQARAGNLSYNPETGLDLELLNAFDDRGVVPIVHGTIDRLPVTLLECAVLSTSLRAFEQVAVQQSLRPQMLLCGIHLEDAQTGCFEAVDVEIENLTEWSAFTDDIQLTYELDDRAPGATEEAQTGQPEAGRSGPLRRMRRLFSRPLQQPADRAPADQVEGEESNRPGWGFKGSRAAPRFATAQGLTAELWRSYSLPKFDERRHRTEVATSATSHLRWSSAQGRSVHEWADAVRLSQDLLSLATFSPCAVLRHTLIPTSAELVPSSFTRESVQVYAQQLVVGVPTRPAMKAWQMLFTLDSIDFEVLMPQWLKVRQMLQATCNMVLGLKYIPVGYVETKLLTAAGAAEVMQGALALGNDLPLPVPKEKFRALRSELLAFVPPEYREWLDKKLYNSLSLQEKLTFLVNQLDPEVSEALLPNPARWAQRTTIARNDLAHRGQSSRVSSEEMVASVEVTVAVVILNLLRELDIPTPRVLMALKNHTALRDAPELARKHWPEPDS